MTTARAAEKARTRQRFVEAAAKLFADRGFHAVSIGDLGTEVGVSGPALYRHFPSKEAILAEILVGTSDYLLSGAEAILAAPHDSDTDLMRALVDFHLSFALDNRDVIRVQDRELATLPDADNRRVRRVQRQYLDHWVDVLERLHPDHDAAQLRVLAHGAFGLLNSTSHSDARVDRAREVLAEACLRALGVAS